MDISSDDLTKLKEYITFSLENNDYEFEFLYKSINNKLNLDKFTKLYQFLKNSSDDYTFHEEKTSLDIRLSSSKGSKFNNYRVTVSDKDILTYCKTNKLSNLSVDYGEKKFIQKSLGKSPFLLSKYDYMKFTLKYDTFLDDTDIIERLNNKLLKQNKNFRYKKRFTFFSKNKYFKIDLTLVKSANNSLSIVDSGLLNTKSSYELEIELNNDNIDYNDSKSKDKLLKDIISELFNVIGNLMIVLFDSKYIIKSEEDEEVLKGYLKLVKKEEGDLIKVRKNSKKNFIGVQPKTLELMNLTSESMVNILNDYTVTDKADGERYILYTHSDNRVYLINNRLNIKYTGYTHNMKDSILDGEYITKDKHGNKLNMFLIFDVYYLKGKNVSKYPLMKDVIKSRINLINEYLKDGFKGKNNDNLKIDLKNFYNSDILKNSKKILNNFKNKDLYKIDGLIFTPANLPVGGFSENDEPKLFGSWNRVFKWKPPEENTIDFLIEFQGDIVINNIKTKLCKLFVGYNDSIQIDIIKILKREFKDEIYGLKEFAQTNLEYKDNKLYTLEGDIILDKTIIEFSYNGNKWIPNRVRKDKTELYKNSGNIGGTANDYTTAQNVWNSINMPVTVDIITGKEKVNMEMDTKSKMENDIYYAREVDRDKSLLRPLLNFHNYNVKNMFLISRFKGRRSLYDIACGQGGDLLKWIRNDFKTVLASDINKDNLINTSSGIYKRYNSYLKTNIKSEQKMLFMQLDASKIWNREYFNTIKDDTFRDLAKIAFGDINKSEIENHSVLLQFHDRARKRFDVVSCMFAIHYMFDSMQSLRNCINNIDNLLKEGGYFIGTCLDASLVDDKFSKSKNDKIEGKKNNKLLWSIEKNYKKYDVNKPINNIGLKIKVYVETINQELDEYLVDYNLLKIELGKKNIFPVKDEDLKEIKLDDIGASSGSFEKIYNEYNKKNKQNIDMDKVNQEFSFMNRWFIFKKY